MISDKVTDIPTDPGVYRFIDLDGETAYVGQSGTSVRARLRQHFIRQDSSVASQGRLDPWDISYVDWWVTGSDESTLVEQQLIAAENPYLNFEDATENTSPSIINVEEPHGTFRLIGEDEREFRSQPYNRAKQKLEHLTRMLDKIKFANHSEQTRRTLFEHKRILDENIEEFLGISMEDRE